MGVAGYNGDGGGGGGGGGGGLEVMCVLLLLVMRVVFLVMGFDVRRGCEGEEEEEVKGAFF